MFFKKRTIRQRSKFKIAHSWNRSILNSVHVSQTYSQANKLANNNLHICENSDFLDGTKKRRPDWVSSCAPTHFIVSRWSPYLPGATGQGRIHDTSKGGGSCSRAGWSQYCPKLVHACSIGSSTSPFPSRPFSSLLFLLQASSTSFAFPSAFPIRISAAMLQWLRLINRPEFPTMETSLFS